MMPECSYICNQKRRKGERERERDPYPKPIPCTKVN